MTADWQALVALATRARQQAYAPYSRFAVGAALQWRDGQRYGGANVENCSYGLTLCAERSAIAASVAAGQKTADLVFLVVVTDAERLTAPCGACRQVLLEFAAADARVLLHSLRGAQQEFCAMAELLPRAFLPANLQP